jgi:DNA polymerase beta
MGNLNNKMFSRIVSIKKFEDISYGLVPNNGNYDDEYLLDKIKTHFNMTRLYVSKASIGDKDFIAFNYGKVKEAILLRDNLEILNNEGIPLELAKIIYFRRIMGLTDASLTNIIVYKNHLISVDEPEIMEHKNHRGLDPVLFEYSAVVPKFNVQLGCSARLFKDKNLKNPKDLFKTLKYRYSNMSSFDFTCKRKVTNEYMAFMFDMLAEQKTNYHKGRAMKNAAKAIKSLDFEIEDISQVKNVKGIGAGSKTRIDELLKTGTLKEITNMEELETILELQKISGIGPVKSKNLVRKCEVTSVNDLRDKVKNGLKLTSHQRIGLKYFEDFLKLIPRKEIDHMKIIFDNIMTELCPEVNMDIVGSYRREKSHSGDIDILFTHPENTNYLGEFVKKLRELKILSDDLSLGEKKYMGVYKNSNGVARRLDVRQIDNSNYPAALLHYTGSGNSNIRMRKVALSMNMTLCEYGLYHYDVSSRKKKFLIKTSSEREIFEILGQEFVEPKNR